MQLNDLETAWKQLKFLNAMHPIESKEILSIIETQENTTKDRLQRFLFNVIMCVVLIIICQSG